MWLEDPLLVALGLTIVLAISVLVYIHDSLSRVIEDYTGDTVRAKFWTSLAQIFVVLVPVVSELVIVGRPEPSAMLTPHEVLACLKWGMLGLVGGLVSVAIVVGTIGRSGVLPVWVNEEQADSLNRMLLKIQEIRARELVERLDRESDAFEEYHHN